MLIWVGPADRFWFSRVTGDKGMQRQVVFLQIPVCGEASLTVVSIERHLVSWRNQVLAQSVLGWETIHTPLTAKHGVVNPYGHVLVKSGFVIITLPALMATEVVVVF